MKRYILTGAPGCGKTAMIRQLEFDGFAVIEEAATDVIALEQAHGIASPWKGAEFIDLITALQVQREVRSSSGTEQIEFHDRSIICTVALAQYLGHPISEMLKRELDRVRQQSIFERRIFFIENLGFITPTAARTINFEETLRFERIHEETYRSLGYELFRIPPGTVAERVNTITKAVAEV